MAHRGGRGRAGRLLWHPALAELALRARHLGARRDSPLSADPLRLLRRRRPADSARLLYSRHRCHHDHSLDARTRGLGPVTHRTYFDVEGPDRSALGEQVGRQRARVIERLRDVKRVIAIVSGKGGVGKSYVTAALARSIAQRAAATGVLDADLQSPTVARLL